jgi:hypothetical protein
MSDIIILDFLNVNGYTYPTKEFLSDKKQFYQIEMRGCRGI